MIRYGLLLIGTAAILATDTTSVYAFGGSAGGGIMLGNVDVRALEPPVDVRRKQLRAQDPRYLDQGRSVGVPYRPSYDPRLDD